MKNSTPKTTLPYRWLACARWDCNPRHIKGQIKSDLESLWDSLKALPWAITYVVVALVVPIARWPVKPFVWLWYSYRHQNTVSLAIMRQSADQKDSQ